MGINVEYKILKPLSMPKQILKQYRNEESDSDIEVMEEVLVNSSKTPIKDDCNSSDSSNIDEASGTESDIVPCDDNVKMFTDEENRIYHDKLIERERKRKESEKEQVVQNMQKNNE